MKYKYEIVQVSDEEWEERKLGSAYILDGGVKGVVIDGLGHEEPDGTEVGLLVIRVEEKEEYRELSSQTNCNRVEEFLGGYDE